MKLRKRLREIERIQERVSCGAKVDHLQMAKLEKHAEVLAQIARAEEDVRVERQSSFESQGSCHHTSTPEVLVTEDSVNAQAAEVRNVWSWPAYGTQDSSSAWIGPQGAVRPSEMQKGLSKRQLAEQGLMAELVEQAQQQAEARAAKEATSWNNHNSRQRCELPRRRDTLPRASFAVRVGKLAQDLDASGAVRENAIVAIGSAAVQLALDAAGCRLLQYALETADVNTAAQLSARLQGHVRELIHSPHGNYVIQKVIQVLPLAQAGFVVDELLGAGAVFARHRFGCRVLCRILEHASGEEPGKDAVTELLMEVVADAIDLSRHDFGKHVIQSLIEYGRPAQRGEVINKLCRDLTRSLMNHNASFVIEKILTDCGVEERRVVLDRVASGGSEVQAVLARRGRLAVRITRLLNNCVDEDMMKMGVRRSQCSTKSETTTHGLAYVVEE